MRVKIDVLSAIQIKDPTDYILCPCIHPEIHTGACLLLSMSKANHVGKLSSMNASGPTQLREDLSPDGIGRSRDTYLHQKQSWQPC
jgi:hypothetical protein